MAVKKGDVRAWSTYEVSAFIAIIVFVPLLFPGRIGSSDGSHTGVVTAVEHNSNIIWASDIVYFKTVRESSQEDTYCVNSPDVKNQLFEAQKDRSEVTIFFKNDYIMWKWKCNGGQSVVYKVEYSLQNLLHNSSPESIPSSE